MRFRAAVCILLTAAVACAMGGTRDFHISPRGNDRNPGTELSPFRSIDRARSALRALRQAHPDLGDTVRLLFHAGTYLLASPIVLGPEDGGTETSPTVYSAAGSDRVLFSGGVSLRGWRVVREGGREEWKALLPSAIRGATAGPHELWVNGRRRPNARIPDEGYLSVDSIPGASASTEWLEGQTAFIGAQTALLRAFDAADAEVVVMTRWVESHLPVTAFDSSACRFSFGRHSLFRIDRGDPYYIVNSRSGLDRPGEWFVDRRLGEVTYLPGEGDRISSLEAVVPLSTQLFRVAGDSLHPVRHLLLKGLTFSHAEWYFPAGFKSDHPSQADAGGFVQAATGVPAALEFQHAHDCAVMDCRVTHTGTYGIELGQGCHHNRILNCELSDLGGGGIKIGSKSIASSLLDATADNLVQDCRISGGGTLFHSAIGIWIGQSPRNRLLHNEVCDLYYSGISIGWTWGYGPADAEGNRVEWNHVHHIGRLANKDGPVLSDMGGIYTLGSHRGTVICHNVFHDIAARVYGGWGIYFDEGTTGLRAENNLVYATTHGAFHQHYGKENIVRNNIFAFSRDQQVQRSRAEGHMSFAFERNIVAWSTGRLFYGNLDGRPFRGGQPDGGMFIDNNCYWPGARAFEADSLSLTEWRSLGYDMHSIVQDPLFQDPENNDFHLRPGSPALRVGFVPFEYAPCLDRAPMGEIELRGASGPKPRRLLYNNDGSNILMAYDTLIPRQIYERIDPVASAGVTTFLHNVNPGQNMGYPSAKAAMFHWENPPEAKPGDSWALLGRRMSRNLEELVKTGIDPVRVVLDRTRLRGLEVFLTFRMNELHDVDKAESPLLSRFWKDHPEWRVGGYEGWGKEALNYTVPSVRDYFNGLLAEVVDRYDLDGLELDFMRFPYYFPFRKDSLPAYAEIMTGFVRQVRSLIDSTSFARKRRILLAVRVPSSLAGCAHVGLDPASWATNRLIDMITVAPFLSTETDLPVGEFKKACPGIPVYACLEFTIGSRQMTREEKRAAAASLYAAGADGIYLFNYFVAWDAGLAADMEVLRELAEPDSLAGKDKLYTLAVPRYPVPGVSLPSPLPLALPPDTPRSVVIRTFEKKAPVTAVLRVECDADVEPDEISVQCNGQSLGAGVRPGAPQIFPQPSWPELPSLKRTVEFIVDPTLVRDEVTITITAHRATADGPTALRANAPRAKALRVIAVNWVYLGLRF